ncbi:hypothetical protein [Bacillus halotolerans]|uniref:Uncharacterized protein n=1 Tax=Bacillus halotolerans TaxID=260554 RepID=A0A9Q6F238_9BACI|nr:hypothetical protein [Bacillus halotolerans]PLS07633.1 hypothetical protein CUU63_10075 [Bacillus halotolerans]
MTLIVGVILPTGILLVSDTRETEGGTLRVVSDMTKKISFLTPDILIGLAGTESNWFVSQILRDTIYNKSSSLSREVVINEVLSFYQNVNTMRRRIKQDTLGPIMISEFTDNNSFTIKTLDSDNDYNKITTFTQIGNIATIGSSYTVRQAVQNTLKDELDRTDDKDLSTHNFHKYLAGICKKIFIQVNKMYDPTVGSDLYCVYLSSINSIAANECFFIGNEIVAVDYLDFDRTIKLKK